MQEAMKETDNRVLLLQASLGVPVDDPKGGHMSIWDAISTLRAAGLKDSKVTDDTILHIDDLKKHLPHWGTRLSNVSASYLDTIPKINQSLVTVRSRLEHLENGGPSVATNSVSGVGIRVPAKVVPITKGPYVLQSNYELNKQDVDTLLANVNAAMLNGGVGSVAAINNKVDKAIKHLREIEG
jgi:hypothetical protein